MKIVIVTGLSGSGKSEALNVFEDIGYYCVDNLPPSLLSKIAELSINSQGSLEKLAIGIDARGYKLFTDHNYGLDQLKSMGVEFEILFLEANDETLVKRYKTSRRAHPLGKENNLLAAINEEKEMLKAIRSNSKYIINTSNLSAKNLKEELTAIFSGEGVAPMLITVSSFGFKHGAPMDADLVFDVRFMPNPHYIDELRPLTGDDKRVQDYVMNSEDSHIFFNKLNDMIDFLIPKYMEEGKSQLSIAIGCTGGRHRSVTMTNKLYDHLKEKNYRVFKKHRDYTLS